MQIYQAILLGIIEGLTEFLPISSTFHLIFAASFIGLEQTEFLKFFTVFIQAGGILAVLFLYGKELWQDHSLIKKISLSFIPTALLGFLLYPVIKNTFFESDLLMIAVFIIFGLIFIFYEKYLKNKDSKIKSDINDLTWKQSFMIGLAQALSVIPGVSRSGIIILFMMMLGQKRSSAAKYSFLLAIPTILGTAIFDLIKTNKEFTISNLEITSLAAGFLTSFVVSLFVLRWFIGYLQKNSLASFGYYRLALGLLLLFLL